MCEKSVLYGWLKLLRKKSLSCVFSGFIIVSIIAPSFIALTLPKTAYGQFVPTWDSWTFEEVINTNIILGSIDVAAGTMVAVLTQLEVKENILDGIAFGLLNTILSFITDSLVRWINSGFQGSPGFIQDPRGFFASVIDAEIGNFIAGTDFGFLCNGFDMDIRLALNLKFATGGFRDRHDCTLSQIINNVQTGWRDTSPNGWDGWLSMTTVPENNIYGAYVVAEEELAVRIGDRTFIDTKLLDWGDGFLSQTECNNGKCEVITPGSVVEDQINDALKSGKRRVEVADEINEIIGALINQLISMAMGGLASASSGGAPAQTIDTGLIGRRAGGTLDAPTIPLGTLGTTSYDGSSASGPTGNQLPPPGTGTTGPSTSTTTTVIGANLTGATVQGRVTGANIGNITFTPGGGILRLRADSLNPITTTGRIRAMGGTNLWLCPVGGCSAANPPIRITNIATETGRAGIEINITTAQRPMQTSSGVILADPNLGRTIGVYANNVDIAYSGAGAGTPNIIRADITNATIIGNITRSQVEGGRITFGTVATGAHFTIDNSYTSSGGGAVTYLAGTTQNVSQIDLGAIQQGTVLAGTLTAGPYAGRNLANYTIAYNYNYCPPTGCSIVTGGTLSNIRGVQAVTSRGGIIETGDTRGEADLRNSASITGVVIDQGTVR